MTRNKSWLSAVLVLALLGGVYLVFLAALAQSARGPHLDGGQPFLRDSVTVIPARGGAAFALEVELADAPHQRQQGRHLNSPAPVNAGRLFAFPRLTDRPLSTDGYRQPVSVALLSRGGEILEVFDLAPCTAPTCPVHSPRVAYRGRLEVPLGWFAQRGIGAGGRLEADLLKALPYSYDYN
ncbi:MAG: DUF192 domain-containing protein [Meiothermus sp.]|nr:DUF192 domain-containing protein [Meiothermus sp.]